MTARSPAAGFRSCFLTIEIPHLIDGGFESLPAMPSKLVGETSNAAAGPTQAQPSCPVSVPRSSLAELSFPFHPASFVGSFLRDECRVLASARLGGGLRHATKSTLRSDPATGVRLMWLLFAQGPMIERGHRLRPIPESSVQNLVAVLESALATTHAR